MKKYNGLLSLLLILCCYAGKSQAPIVQTANGMIRGAASGAVQIFKGIPFAAPPVGNLRWKAPQPVANWTGTKECTRFAASPFQPKPVPFSCWTEEFIAPPEPLSEDCLYLNVWTNGTGSREQKPVFVWIYGGGFVSGSAACAVYDGEEMAKQGVVFVSINYRVGPFGFMAHPELSKEQNNASGNYGIQDQIAALKWIQQNIAAFGGNPSQVTIAGQSAGSMSVNALIASPLAKGLFHAAIVQSGGLLGNRLPASLASAETIGLEFQKKATTTSLAELRQLPAEDILKTSQAMGMMRMGLVSDGYVLPQDIVAHFKEGKQNQVPLLIGWVTGDGGLFGPSTITAAQHAKQSADKYGTAAKEYLQIFPGATDKEAQQSQQKFTLMAFAAYPAHLMAGYNTASSYIYQFSHVPTDKPGFPNYGAFHTSEVPYALRTLHKWQRPWQQSDKTVETVMSSYWINFIKTGNPNGSNLPQWNAYKKQPGDILEINTQTQNKPALLAKEFAFLDANGGIK
ncbi:MAG: carboxylesterase family protein [Flavihumibacter sp.]|nr:carboxylesterase family protein [Flavihumibacter sp.]